MLREGLQVGDGKRFKEQKERMRAAAVFRVPGASFSGLSLGRPECRIPGGNALLLGREVSAYEHHGTHNDYTAFVP